MKFLTVCDGGNVRSHCMAVVLKELGHESVAIGRWALSPDSIGYMGNWADVIIIMEPHMIENFHETFHHKIHIIDVGPDYYGVGINPDLRKKCEEGRYYLLGKLQKEGKV